jgi:hypothetical protein
LTLRIAGRGGGKRLRNTVSGNVRIGEVDVAFQDHSGDPGIHARVTKRQGSMNQPA